MNETVGTLTLKIERLQQKLHQLALQYTMSSPYPDLHQRLQQDTWKATLQLQQLTQAKEALLQK